MLTANLQGPNRDVSNLQDERMSIPLLPALAILAILAVVVFGAVGMWIWLKKCKRNYWYLGMDEKARKR